MRRGHYQREVIERLSRIEGNLDRLSRELARMIEQKRPAQPSQESMADEWLLKGIDNIMAFQAGASKRDGEK